MASDATPPFVLARCTPDDLVEIIDLQYHCFPDFVRLKFMGCHSTAELPRYREITLKHMLENPHDVWIAVRDTETGRCVAASNWRLYVNGEGGARDADQPPPWLEGEELEQSRSLIASMNEMRSKHMPGPFIHLHICFTHPDYRRRGAGGMMMQWGCALADQLFVPGWIEASEEGNFLYESFGFYEFAKIASEGATYMKRDARTQPLVGGRAKG
ncbi:hypothetical protein LTR08_001963 [Meristemomyces frigidus]|nr:hypothetical protein LTR08_001963 [Meristemomyces frigidus]